MESVQEYLAWCFKALSEDWGAVHFVVVQLCYVHMLKTFGKDITKCYGVNATDKQKHYLKYLFRKGMSVSTSQEGQHWLEAVLATILSRFKTSEYEKSKSTLRLMRIM